MVKLLHATERQGFDRYFLPFMTKLDRCIRDKWQTKPALASRSNNFRGGTYVKSKYAEYILVRSVLVTFLIYNTENAKGFNQIPSMSICLIHFGSYHHYEYELSAKNQHAPISELIYM